MALSPALGSRGLAPLLAVVLLIAAPVRARADDPRVPPAFVEIATIEHRRTGVAGLDPYLSPDADPAARRRAIVALGRIGTDDDEVVRRLRMLVRRGGADLELALWAAGISGQKALLPVLLAHVGADGAASERIAAIDAVGLLGDTRADGFLIPLLVDEDAAIRTAAGYALSRAGSDRALEAVVARAIERNPEARRAIAAAIWRCAGVRKKARSTKDAPWPGDDAAAQLLIQPLSTDPDPETRIFALRALASLWPQAVRWEQIRDRVKDSDPRVVADFLSRLTGGGHTGSAILEAANNAIDSDDALVRETAAETMEKVGDAEGAGALRDRLAKEPDARVRERIAIALAACGDDDAAAKVLAREDRPKDPAARAATQARVLLASKKPESFAKAVAMLRDPKTPVLALEALLDGFGDVDATPELEAALREVLAHPDPVVRSSAASLIGDKKLTGLRKELDAALASPRPVGDVDTERDARQGVLEAVFALDAVALSAIHDEEERKAQAVAVCQAWDAALRKERSAGVRRALLEKIASTGLLRQMPTLRSARYADLPKNDWRGLPRPKTPILGLDFSGGTGRLNEEEVLRLAARIAERGVQLAVETEGLGTTTYRLDAEEAPVHAASTVLAAASGVYDGTSWHRVVPAFVIQGADPRGDGSGDAGWLLPDEITHRPFLRGALGMPKGVKDTGGCQLFAMHCYAPHLDGHYTAFGAVVEGQKVVDRIRVGDRIRSVRIVETQPGK